MSKVSTYQGEVKGRKLKRESRLMVDKDSGGHFWAKLYHPNERNEVEKIVDLHLKANGSEKPVSRSKPSDLQAT